MAGSLCIVYYCSGHGFGHATRVSAFASQLLSLNPKPTLYIVSSAPEHVFSGGIVSGAKYRYAAEIDPVVVQPLAYSVDRQASVSVLKQFLESKTGKLAQETEWLRQVHAQCVLSDAAFLGCLAANTIDLPSVLITNFTFDSVYSYLSTTLTVHAPPDKLQALSFADLVPDVPVPQSEIQPLVDEIVAGYRCADLLLLLPGFIPIPSFAEHPILPSRDWIDPTTNILDPQIKEYLARPVDSWALHSSIPFPGDPARLDRTRLIMPAPLLVRAPTNTIYTPEGRKRLLGSIGVPMDQQGKKILVVSFGGQVFRKPSRTPSRRSSTVATPEVHSERDLFASSIRTNSFDTPSNSLESMSLVGESPRLSTTSHLWIPGAPAPAMKRTLTASASNPVVFQANMIPPTPVRDKEEVDVFSDAFEEEPMLLPDESWIAVVCGVSKQQWDDDEDEDGGLPEGFYVAPKDVYMPDLTALGDVLLGKLGYGTVSECVDSCTPFVYVSRPLFIEEHGLKMLLEREGVGLELSREAYEEGDWSHVVDVAWKKGQAAKAAKRARGETGERGRAVKEMAEGLMTWIESRVYT